MGIYRTAWGACRDYKLHMRGVHSISSDSTTGLRISQKYAQEHLQKPTLEYGILFDGYYYFAAEDAQKPLADSRKIRESVLSGAISAGQNPVDVEKKIIRSLSGSDIHYLLEIGKRPDLRIRREYLEKKRYEKRVKARCNNTIIACSGEHDTLMIGVVKVYTAEGSEHLVSKSSYKALLDNPRLAAEMKLSSLDNIPESVIKPIPERLHDYAVSLSLEYLDRFNLSSGQESDSDRKLLYRIKSDYCGSIMSCEDAFVKGVESTGASWGEAIIAFGDVIRKVQSSVPIEFRDCYIFPQYSYLKNAA